jgi:dCTP deaminase
MILPAQTIRALRPIEPFCERTMHRGMTYGLGPAGYDVRIAETVTLRQGGFCLASTIERFEMPDDLLAIVHDKSTWARRGLCVQNTVLEPNWRGFLTLELSMHAPGELEILAGDPIAQIVFHRLEAPTEQPYDGRYQDQAAGPQEAR